MSRFWSSGCIELELDDHGNFGDRKDTGDTCGCHWTVPYKTPLLPYLQGGLSSDMCVIFPDLVFYLSQFQLLNGSKERLASSCFELPWSFGHLPSQVSSRISAALQSVTNKDWAEIAEEEYQKLNKSNEPFKNLPQLPPEEAAHTDFFVDVFAAMAGDLKWDSNFQFGRRLAKQRLFTIEGKGHKVEQSFNAADWLTNWSMDESFDERVMPSLHCLDRNHQEPLTAAELFAAVPRLQGFSIGRTEDLSEKALTLGYRVASHQHVPEPLKSSKGGRCKGNLHTFLRPVGHRILEKNLDRDSRIGCLVKAWF